MKTHLKSDESRGLEAQVFLVFMRDLAHKTLECCGARFSRSARDSRGAKDKEEGGTNEACG